MIDGLPDLKPGLTIGEARRILAQAFKQAGLDEADADARLLLGHVLQLDRMHLLSQSNRPLDDKQATSLRDVATRRIRREPVARIIGRKEFWSLTLAVNESVLIPRPDTETLIELALDLVGQDGLRDRALRILDIGTGSGAIALALLSELPNAEATMTDISDAALSTARANAEALGLTARCVFRHADMAAGLEGPFDLVVSNPPYIAHDDIATLDADVRDYDPLLALDGGADGLDAYRDIARQTPPLLPVGGRVIVELGMGQEKAVGALFAQAGLTVGPVRTDLAGIVRAIAAQKCL